MKEYFATFEKLLTLMAQNLMTGNEIEINAIDNVIQTMTGLANSDKKLTCQLNNIKFYETHVKQMFKRGISQSYKTSLYEQLKQEKTLLEEFAKQNRLF